MYTIKAYVDSKEYTIHDARVKALTVGGNPYFEIGDNMKIFLEQRKSSSKENLPFCATASRDRRFIIIFRSKRMCRI